MKLIMLLLIVAIIVDGTSAESSSDSYNSDELDEARDMPQSKLRRQTVLKYKKKPPPKPSKPLKRGELVRNSIRRSLEDILGELEIELPGEDDIVSLAMPTTTDINTEIQDRKAEERRKLEINSGARRKERLAALAQRYKNYDDDNN